MSQKDNEYQRLSRARQAVIAVLACIFLPLALVAAMGTDESSTRAPLRISDTVPEIKPQIPGIKRGDDKRVFLERADRMLQNERDSFIIVTGNVEFSHGAMLMFCDSAHFYPESESFNAYGNVHMEQGDTLFIYGEQLNYDGHTHKAILYGKANYVGTIIEWVRLINRDVTLTTPILQYDLDQEFGYYVDSGKLSDARNELTSEEGLYVPGTKDADFYNNVFMTSISEGGDTVTVETDTLYYNTDTHIAQIISPTVITNADATIQTTSGEYNTETSIANLYARSTVTASSGTVLTGDTLIYDRNVGYSEVYGNMEIVDMDKSIIFTGDYGYYNEISDSAFATGHALAREFSQSDTLYLHARYFISYSVTDTTEIVNTPVTPEVAAADTTAIESLDSVSASDAAPIMPELITKADAPEIHDTISAPEIRIDTTYVMEAYPRVRFYRDDMQGVCDSMRFEQRDTMLYMYHSPIIWSDQRQIYGGEVHIHLNDSTMEWAKVANSAMSAEHVEDNFYNQLAGREMLVHFVDGEMRQLDVNGNVRIVMFPVEEKDSTINKVVNANSSYLTADFLDNAILRMKMWPETDGTVTPLFVSENMKSDSRFRLYFLDGFKWYENIRPDNPENVFDVSEEMEALMSVYPLHEPKFPEQYLQWIERQKTEGVKTDEGPQVDEVSSPIKEDETQDKTEAEDETETQDETETETNGKEATQPDAAAPPSDSGGGIDEPEPEIPLSE